MKKTLFIIFCIFSLTSTNAFNERNLEDGDNYSLSKYKIKSKGKFRGVVLLVEFVDSSFKSNEVKGDMSRILNKSGNINDTEWSVRDYFTTNSDSLFIPSFDVVGPIKVSRPMAYYGENCENGEECHIAEMVVEACRKASSKCNFTTYDNNEDGIVDMIYVLHASYSENENTSHKNLIWSHAGNVADSNLVIDGKRIERYACSSEFVGKIGEEKVATIGIFCHEFSHILGLPDFYNTRNGGGMTLDCFSVMDRGNYIDNGCHPIGYSEFEKEYVGWKSVPEISFKKGINNIILYPTNDNRFKDSICAFKITIPNSKESFYFENRQPNGTDLFIPAAGLLVYHIDRSASLSWDRNEVNIDFKHPRYQIIKAGGKYEMDFASFPFPGKKGETVLESPDLWIGGKAPFELKNISSENGIIKMDIWFQ